MRTNPTKFDFDFPCPNCGYRIPPAEILRIDGERIRCPKCAAEPIYNTRKPMTTS